MRSGRLRTWLQLVRAPNLFTVPGDPLVGGLLASGGFFENTVWYAVGASLCLYAAGLLMNDVADLEEDRRERPARPLPNGAAGVRTVWAVVGVLVAGGMLGLWQSGHPAALSVGAVLVAAIALYNWLTKPWPVIGALNMGLCRTLSVLLGVIMFPAYGRGLGILAGILIGLYIAAVTNLARHETRDRASVLARCLPVAGLLFLGGLGIQQSTLSPEKMGAGWLFAVVVVAALWVAVRLFRRPQPLPPLIGAFIRLLLPLQAALCLFADPYETGRWAALALLACWPLAALVSRRFYAS